MYTQTTDRRQILFHRLYSSEVNDQDDTNIYWTMKKKVTVVFSICVF